MRAVLRSLLIGLALYAGSIRGNEDSDSTDETPEELDSNYCSRHCKHVFVGDRSCDVECYNEACQWDGGDCDDQWEVRRTVVMGPFFNEVEFVEYHAQGPNGEKKKLTIEQGRHWEGTDTRSSEERANWRRMLSANEDHDFLSSTELGMPPWWLDKDGNKVPSYREDESGVKISIDLAGNDILDESGNPQVWFGVAGPQGKLHGLDYEYDEYYYEE